MNDILLAALHDAIGEWNAEYGASTHRIGVMLPINMRPPEWRQDVMANVVLPARVTTKSRDRAETTRLLRAVTDQTRRFKELDTGAALIEILGRSPALPLGVKEALSPLLWVTGNRLVDTAILSNLGRLTDPPVFGTDAGATTAAWFSAPARMPLGLSVGVVTVEGQLHIVFRYRHALFDEQAARRFAQRFLAALDRCA